ncbi:MAG: oligosaccharide flippase family protein [Crocinitomicaceae bacterium]|nr:oligosaccharide flippase family protein [Crocinitomicaceae bacterium]
MKIRQLYRSKFGKDTIWLLFGQVAAMSSGLFLNLFIGYKYGTAALGTFNQSLAYYLIFSSLFALGLNNTLVKKISEKSRNQNEENKLFTTNLLITFIVSSLLSFVLIVVVHFFPGFISSAELVKVLPAMFMALPLFCINKNFAAYYSGNRKQKNVAFQRIYRWTGLATLFYAGIVYHYSIELLMYSFLLVEGTMVILNILINIKHFDFNISSKLIRENIRFGMGSYISEITSTFNNSIDIILVAYFLSDQEAGQYSFIAFFVRTLYVFPGILMQNVSPIISRHWKRKAIEELNIKLRKVRYINLIVLTLQVLLLLGLYKIVILQLNGGFETTYEAFLIALAGTFVFAQISWGGSILIMTERLKANFYRTLLVLILNIIVCSLFTYTLDFTGSVVAISTNALLSFLLLRTFVYQKTGVRLI